MIFQHYDMFLSGVFNNFITWFDYIGYIKYYTPSFFLGLFVLLYVYAFTYITFKSLWGNIKGSNNGGVVEVIQNMIYKSFTDNIIFRYALVYILVVIFLAPVPMFQMTPYVKTNEVGEKKLSGWLIKDDGYSNETTTENSKSENIPIVHVPLVLALPLGVIEKYYYGWSSNLETYNVSKEEMKETQISQDIIRNVILKPNNYKKSGALTTSNCFDSITNSFLCGDISSTLEGPSFMGMDLNKSGNVFSDIFKPMKNLVELSTTLKPFSGVAEQMQNSVLTDVLLKIHLKPDDNVSEVVYLDENKLIEKILKPEIEKDFKDILNTMTNIENKYKNLQSKESFYKVSSIKDLMFLFKKDYELGISEKNLATFQIPSTTNSSESYNETDYVHSANSTMTIDSINSLLNNNLLNGDVVKNYYRSLDKGWLLPENINKEDFINVKINDEISKISNKKDILSRYFGKMNSEEGNKYVKIIDDFNFSSEFVINEISAINSTSNIKLETIKDLINYYKKDVIINEEKIIEVLNVNSKTIYTKEEVKEYIEYKRTLYAYNVLKYKLNLLKKYFEYKEKQFLNFVYNVSEGVLTELDADKYAKNLENNIYNSQLFFNYLIMPHLNSQGGIKAQKQKDIQTYLYIPLSFINKTNTIDYNCKEENTSGTISYTNCEKMNIEKMIVQQKDSISKEQISIYEKSSKKDIELLEILLKLQSNITDKALEESLVYFTKLINLQNLDINKIFVQNIEEKLILKETKTEEIITKTETNSTGIKKTDEIKNELEVKNPEDISVSITQPVQKINYYYTNNLVELKEKYQNQMGENSTELLKYFLIDSIVRLKMDENFKSPINYFKKEILNKFNSFVKENGKIDLTLITKMLENLNVETAIKSLEEENIQLKKNINIITNNKTKENYESEESITLNEYLLTYYINKEKIENLNNLVSKIGSAKNAGEQIELLINVIILQNPDGYNIQDAPLYKLYVNSIIYKDYIIEKNMPYNIQKFNENSANVSKDTIWLLNMARDFVTWMMQKVQEFVNVIVIEEEIGTILTKGVINKDILLGKSVVSTQDLNSSKDYISNNQANFDNGYVAENKEKVEFWTLENLALIVTSLSLIGTSVYMLSIIIFAILVQLFGYIYILFITPFGFIYSHIITHVKAATNNEVKLFFENVFSDSVQKGIKYNMIWMIILMYLIMMEYFYDLLNISFIEKTYNNKMIEYIINMLLGIENEVTFDLTMSTIMVPVLFYAVLLYAGLSYIGKLIKTDMYNNALKDLTQDISNVKNDFSNVMQNVSTTKNKMLSEK